MSIIRAGHIRHDRGETVLTLDQVLGPDAEALLRRALERMGDPKGETCDEMEFDEGGIIARGIVRDGTRAVIVNGEAVRYERRIA